MSKLTRADLPDTDPGVFWELKRNPKSGTKPVLLLLRRDYDPDAAAAGRSTPAITLGQTYTTADPADIRKDAEELVRRCQRVDDVLGVFR